MRIAVDVDDFVRYMGKAVRLSRQAPAPGAPRSILYGPVRTARVLILLEAKVGQNYYCPYCMSSVPTVEVRDGGEQRLACGNCGYPIGAEAAGKAEVQRPDRPKVLSIDDDKLLLGMFVDVLRAEGFQPLVAPSGLAGIELARKTRPDLIVLDVMMPPGMSGIEVCRTLRADPAFAATPIIVITALDNPRIGPQATEAGATLVMPKPYEVERLLEAIRQALADSRASGRRGPRAPGHGPSRPPSDRPQTGNERGRKG